MSVVIRLQNLPLSAKSADIRNFFGGLRIPSGGVHIIGGEKGEAFIAFNSDEDARLAMRKDGGKIKDDRIKLILSSRMEMQYEVEKITRNSQTSLQYPKSERETSADSHQKLLGKTSGSDRSSETYRRSRSPSALGGSRRSRSPRRRGQSHRSRSPSSRNYFSRGEASAVGKGRDLDLTVSQTSESSKAISEIQAQLEKRIAEAIESNPILMSRYSDSAYTNVSETSNISSELMYAQYQKTTPLQSSNYSETFSKESSTRTETYYVSLSGLDPYWDFHDVRTIINPIYVSRDNFCWERDNRGERTGAAIIRLTNRNDFETLMRNTSFVLHNRLINISEYYPSLASQYFSLPKNENRDLCYLLKGLPYACAYDNIVAFFSGYEVADVVIFYDDNGKATGLGYVSFTNERDFKDAYSRNKQFILNRFIQMFPCTDQEMAEAKECISRKVAESLMVKKSRRTLCALITGLPSFTSVKKLAAFFEESGFAADAIHITLNRRKCDGRAFIEFVNFRDFDLALKLNGTKFQDLHAICVKQILYDEMVKILEGQKAKHHYNNPDLSLPASEAKAEKVPYLWEPPDAVEEETAKSPPAPTAKAPPFEPSETSLSPPNYSTSVYAPQQDQSHFSPVTSVPPPSHSTSGYTPQQNQSHFLPDTSLPPPNHSTSAYALSQNQPFFSPATPVVNNYDSVVHQPFLAPPPIFDPAMPPPMQPFLPPPANFVGGLPGVGSSFPPFQDNFSTATTTLASSPPSPKQNFNRNAFRSKYRVLSQIPLQSKTEVEVKSSAKQKFSANDAAIIKGAAQSSSKQKFSENDAAIIKGAAQRDPIKFNVNKASGVSAKKNKTFNSEGSTDKKVKLSKLSPPKEAAQKQPEGKDKVDVKKEAMQKEADEKPKAPVVKKETEKKLHDDKRKSPVVKKETEKKLHDDKRKSPVDEKKNLGKDNKRNRNRSRQNQHKNPMSHQRKSNLSPPRRVPCVVQMSNISIDVKTQDLVNFLHGFSYDASSIIRRYTESGEPTGDVRVSFLNRKEADAAIKNLQGCYLKDLQVKMFCV